MEFHKGNFVIGTYVMGITVEKIEVLIDYFVKCRDW